MSPSYPSGVFPRPGQKGTGARVALIGLDEASNALLGECFKQCGIQAVAVGADAAQRLRKERFDACALRLAPEAEGILDAARTSPSNSRLVVYGISASIQDALRFSRFGINAVLPEPLERQAILRVIRSTRLLIIHELRRYVRIPLVTEVRIDILGKSHTATCVEVSASGMSLKSQYRHVPREAVKMTFTLPNSPPVTVEAVVCWVRAPDLLGVRFDAGDQRRIAVKRWIDNYLGTF